MFGDEAGKLGDLGTQGFETLTMAVSGSSASVKLCGGTEKGSAQTVECELAAGKLVAAGLEFAKGVEHYVIHVDGLGRVLEKFRLHLGLSRSLIRGKV